MHQAQKFATIALAAMLAITAHAQLPPNHGHYNQGYLGVDIRDVPDDQISALKLKDNHGAEIITVDHDAPAGKVDLRVRDVILQVDSTPVENADHFRHLMHETPAGRTVTFIISRQGQSITITAQLANRADVERRAWDQHFVVPGPPPDPNAPAPLLPPDGNIHGSNFVGAPFGSSGGPGFGSSGMGSGGFFDGSIIGGPHATYTGAAVEPVGQLAEIFGTKPGTGLLIKNIDDNSPAAECGLKAGDVILRANKTEIKQFTDWVHAVRSSRGKPIQLEIMRNKQQQTITLTPVQYHHTQGSLSPDSLDNIDIINAIFAALDQNQAAFQQQLNAIQ